MLKWFSNDESSPALGAPVPQEGTSSQPLAEVTDQLAQMEQFVAQLKGLIREKDDVLRTKDEQLKAEKDTCEAKLSKMRLQNRAKVTSLNSKLEDLKNQLALSGAKENRSENTKSGGDGDQEHAAASRGKILLLKKKVEELEQRLTQRDVELGVKTKELEAQRQHGLEVDAKLVEKEKQLLEKEAYIVDLHMSAAGDNTTRALHKPAEEQKLQVQSAEENSSLEDLHLLVQNLTKKVGDSEEKYSLLQEQTEGLKELLVIEKAQFEEKENMYKQNIQTFKDIILQKDNMLIEKSQRHEQELFKLAAKSDASADLEQLLKALKQKLHEKEEVLLGKTQVIDVLQGEVDARDQQIKEQVEKMKRLQCEKHNMQSKLDAEKHVMRAQLWDLMQKHEAELRRVAEKHESELSEKDQECIRWLEELRRTQAITQEGGAPTVPAADPATDTATAQKLLELEAQAKLKAEEASKSEAKFLKMKAWSKSRIKQLEDELKKSQSGKVSPDVSTLRSRITDLVEEREETLCKLEHYDELKIKNEQLIAKLVDYEEQQRKMQADLEQVTKRAASQASESGSADDLQIHVLEWQEIVGEAELAREQARVEKTAMALRMSHIEEEREVLASRQQELEELEQAQGLQQQRGKKLGETALRSLQEDFEFDGNPSYQDPKCTLESTTSMDGENMGGWWPEYSTPDTGLRSVVGELELERNQLQEQIVGLEERCQDLEDRLQLQARIESLQNETERLLGQLASLRSQQSRDAEKHQLLVTSLNKQLKGQSETQECLEKSLIEKEHSIAKTSEKLELIENLQDSLKEKEIQHREVSEKLLQTEHNLTEVNKKCNTFEKQCSELRTSVTELTQKLNILKEKTHKQEATIASLQSDLEEMNDELYKLNSTHLEERAQLIHDLQSCEREIDNLKDTVSDKDKEISALTHNMMEHTEQILELKREVKDKEDALVHIETALTRAEQKALIIKDPQSSDQQALNTKIADLVEQLKTSKCKLSEAKEQQELKRREVEDLIIQVQEDNLTIQTLRLEIQKLNENYGSNLSECESQISSLKEQVTSSSQKLQESETLLSQLKESNTINGKLQDQLQDIEQMYEIELKSFKEERNKLLAELTKHKKELQALSKQLEEHVGGQKQVENVVQGKLKTISLLEQKLNVTQEEAESERLKLNQKLKARDSEIERLTKELQSKSEKLSDLETNVKTLESTNQQQSTVVESNAIELKKQKQLVADLDEKAAITHEETVTLQSQVSKLTEESKKLRQEIADGKRSQSELMEENNTMQTKMSAFEVQHSENHKIIEGLMKEKEELTVRTEELHDVLEQNRSTNLENLLEKTKECSQLTKLLLESKETVADLQEKINLLNSQVEQLKCCVAKKEKMVVDQNTNCENQESQIRQLQENVSLLQEQSTALKSGLMGKDATLQQMTAKCYSLQNVIPQQKEFLSHLQRETESHKKECTKLNQCLEEKEVTLRNKTQECQNYINELSNTSKCVDSLHRQLEVMHEKSVKLESAHADLKVSLENHIANNNKLNEQNNLRQSEVVHLQNHIQALCEENQKLQGALESQEQQKMLIDDFGRKTDVTLEENVNLKAHIIQLREQIQALQQEATDKDKSQSKVVDERNKIQSKISAYEVQHSENCKIIEGLLKEKEELTLRTEELRNVFEQNNSISESLLEKTNECCNLSKLLTESKEMGTHLQQQARFLKSQIDQLHCSVGDNEKTILDQKALYEMQQSQLSQFQETLSLLQEENTALKSELMQKDGTLQQMIAMCTSMENKTLQQKQFLTQLQSESVSLTGKCTRLSQSLEEKEVTLRKKTRECQNQFDELKKSSESVVSLHSQLGVMNGNTLKLESENGNLKTCLANEVSKNDKLREEVAHRKAEMVDLQNYIQVLNEENCKIKTECQNLAAEVTQKLQEMTVLQAELSNKNNNVVSLTERLAAVNLEKESLQMALQQKTESLNQQEIYINQFQAKSVEGEDQLNKKMETIIELQTQVRCMQNYLKQLKDESAVVLKTQSDANTGIINNLQGQLQSMLQKNDQLAVRITEKESELQQKNKDCERLRAQFSELEDLVLQLRNQVEALTSESIRLMGVVKEKEAVLEIQSRSLAYSEMMKVTCKAKVEECDGLKDQLIECQETMSKLSDDLSTRSFEIAKLKEALEEKEVRIWDQTKIQHDLQEKVDEAVLFKAQFMESTELVSQLQGQVQELSSKFEKLCKTAEEKQSAFLNLQEKYADHLEEVHEVKMQLSQRNEERSNLNKALSDCNDAVKTAESTTDAMRNEATLLQDKLQHIQASNAKLSQQNKDALATYQSKMASLIVEIERLKLQHLKVAAEVNALTENLEQRELALHTINNQYSAQVKHAEYLVAEIQKLDEQNKKLKEECSLATQYFEKQLGLSISENEHLQQEVKKTIAEKEELIRSYNDQLRALQKELSFQSQQHLGNMNETVEKMKTEKEHLQVQLKEVGNLRTENAKLTHKNLRFDQHTGKDANKYEAGLAKQRLAEAEQHLHLSRQEVSQLSQSVTEERARREAAEEALSLAQDRAKSTDTNVSRTNPREFSIQLESDDEREALIIDPNEHIVMRKVKSGALSCRRWLRGRRLYCSKLLMSRAKSRYLFLMYLLALHMVVFMCLTGTL
ncbi:hypothetical protein AAFF_G00381930 [Aldrovandia affinis]|uniref:Golgin subfamily B member 1-like n=1 Tax=Aldrovandia affinis TaxID=143900 RepID=A0AAD7X053_9TELE|nr:hypothetical protein AAFF_G00381930 [Aldrovandia affinis]